MGEPEARGAGDDGIADVVSGDRRNAFVRWLEGVNSGERWGGHG